MREEKPVRARPTMGEIKRLRAEVQALRAAISWIDPLFIRGEAASEIVQRVRVLNEDVRRFDLANPSTRGAP